MLSVNENDYHFLCCLIILLSFIERAIPSVGLASIFVLWYKR